MPRKNKLESTGFPNIYELKMADGTTNFIAKFIHNGIRYGEKNITKMRGKTSAKTAFEELTRWRNQLSDDIDIFNVKSTQPLWTASP